MSPRTSVAVVGSSASGGGGAASLLAEAAVRFDFSEYDDVGNMVDVVAGWGPLTPSHSGGSPTLALIAEGLQVTNLAAPGLTRFRIAGVPGPLSFDGDGLTYLSVVRVLEAWDNSPVSAFVLQGDYNNDGAPTLAGEWELINGSEDSVSILHQDQGPGFANIVDDGAVGVETDPVNVGGVFVHVVVLDAAAEVVRSYLASPDGVTTIRDLPFTEAATYTDFSIDYFNWNVSPTGAAFDRVWIESDAWNRALTPAEVAALVAHFTG
jgi:hypothetical protein